MSQLTNANALAYFSFPFGNFFELTVHGLLCVLSLAYATFFCLFAILLLGLVFFWNSAYRLIATIT
uniref:Uncharacterized protein n=1 Tax=Anguilla anguilla TaxID=7936 RepID=A0A0E9WPL6_ANGAN